MVYKYYFQNKLTLKSSKFCNEQYYRIKKKSIATHNMLVYEKPYSCYPYGHSLSFGRSWERVENIFPTIH